MKGVLDFIKQIKLILLVFWLNFENFKHLLETFPHVVENIFLNPLVARSPAFKISILWLFNLRLFPIFSVWTKLTSNLFSNFGSFDFCSSVFTNYLLLSIFNFFSCLGSINTLFYRFSIVGILNFAIRNNYFSKYFLGHPYMIFKLGLSCAKLRSSWG